MITFHSVPMLNHQTAISSHDKLRLEENHDISEVIPLTGTCHRKVRINLVELITSTAEASFPASKRMTDQYTSYNVALCLD